MVKAIIPNTISIFSGDGNPNSKKVLNLAKPKTIKVKIMVIRT